MNVDDRAGPRTKARRRIVPLLAALLAGIAVVVLFDTTHGARLARDQLWALNSLHYAEFDSKLPARQATGWYVGVGPGDLQPDAPMPSMAPAGGFFEGPVQVSVTVPTDSSVHCSTDGSIPTPDQPEYREPFALTATTVLRCRTFRTEHQASETVTQTYLVDVTGALPVLALTVHPSNLWNRYTGIYEQYQQKGKEWERDAYVEYFPRDASPTLALDGRVRINGGYSRSRGKKSFRFYFRPPAGHDPSNILTWSSAANERAVILGAREDDFSRDEFFASIFESAGGMTSARMPVFLYLNGQPWGIYFVRERIDEEYLRRHLGPGDYDLLVAEPTRPRVIAGNRRRWNEMMEFLENSDLADDATFSKVATEFVDVDNFMDYWLFNVYGANADWPHHNMSMYSRRSGPDRRWRWICWDADATFDYGKQGLNHDTLAWATRSTLRHDLRFNNAMGALDAEDRVMTTYLARKLLENAGYRTKMVQRMLALLDTDLSPRRLEPAVDALNAQLEADLLADWRRWSPSDQGVRLAQAYAEDIQRVRQFIRQRPDIIRAHFARLENGTLQASIDAGSE